MQNITEMDFFQQATNRICGSLDINDVLLECLLFFRPYFPIDLISMSLVDMDTHEAVPVATSIRKGRALKPVTQAYPLSQSDIGLIQNNTQEPVTIINDMAHDPPSKKAADIIGSDTLSMMVMTLEARKNTVGFVNIVACGINQYTPEHTFLLSLVKDPFTVALSNTLQHRELKRIKDKLVDDNLYLSSEIRQMASHQVVGRDSGLKEVMDMVDKVTELSNHILLLGETGVGKEVIANAIHYSSPRSQGPFIKVNCGAIPASLIDSELFGYEKGAFTGATNQRRGRFERGDGGTIFLDEIGELSLEAQVKLLRVIQNKEIERIGGSGAISLDIRIIAATHRNLEDLVRTGKFREDLWYRLNVFPITIPPLRHRTKDIRALVEHFIEKKSKEMNLNDVYTISVRALDIMQNYPWPGNVRELENIVERALIHRTFSIIEDWLYGNGDQCHPMKEAPTTSVNLNPQQLDLNDMVRKHIEYVLKLKSGKIYGKNGAAEALGVNPSTLRNRMEKLGIRYKKTKPSVAN